VRTGNGRDPFRALGLAPGRELGDDDIRAAWRRVAAATHPDRADGGDPAAFAAAAAAYTVLRTPTGSLVRLRWIARRRGIARLRLGAVMPWAAILLARIRRGRPLALTLRLLAAAAACLTAVTAAHWQPASFAVIAGVLTWLAVTGRSDLAPPP
jgi:hypothetical protein